MEEEYYTPEELILIPYDLQDSTEAKVCQEINYYTYDWLEGKESSSDFLERVAEFTDPDVHLDWIYFVWKRFGIL